MSAAGRLVRASRSDSSGQTLTLVAIFLPLLLGMLGLAIDTGNLYIAQRHLQTATDAAALAAAQDLPDGTQALSLACTFSATHAGGSCPSGVAATDGQNVSGQLENVSTSAQLECLSAASAGAGCVTGTGACARGANPPAGDAGCNAIKITQTGSVKTFLLGFLGFVNTKVTTSATASMGGGRSSPLDVEVVLDSTSSMQAFDNCGAPSGTSGVTGIPYMNGKTPTAEDCAKAGMRALLETLYPCDPDDSASVTSCASAPAEDEVGLMSIPPLGGNPNPPSGHPAYVSPGNGLGIPAETNCIDDLSGGGYFRYPNGSDVTTSNYDPSNLPQYQFVPLSSDYKLSNATAPMNDSLLNPDSNLVKGVYWGKCPGGVYPVNGGSQGSSLNTPGSGDSSTANNDSSSPLAGGPNTPGYSTKTSNGGAATIAGFPAAGNSSTGSASSSSITISRPGAPAANDYVVVAVTAAGSGSAGTHICKPDSSWTELSQASSGTGSSRITQAVFGSVRSSAGAESYTFSSVNGPTNETTCAGSALSLNLSAVAVRYTGVDPYDPIDTKAVTTGSGTTVTPPAVNTAYANERVVELYSAAGNTLTNLTVGRNVEQATGGSTSNDITGLVDTNQAGAGPSTPVAGTSSGGSWVGYTISLQPMQGSSSIGVTRPPGAANDYVLVSVTASGLPSGLYGSSGSLYICPPSDGTWTTISERTQGNDGSAVTQAVFGSLRTSASDPAYSFSFVDGSSCSSTLRASVQASAVATRYTGIDLTNPVDVVGGSATSQTLGTPTPGSSATLSAPTVTTNHAYDQVVRVYSDASSALTVQNQQSAGQAQTSSESSNVTVITDKAQATATSTTPATATTAAPQNWLAQTIALEPQQGQTTITINRPSNRAAGDLLIVSVTVQGQVAICAPDASWSDVGTGAVSSGTGSNIVTTEAFYSYRSSLDPAGQAYSFAIVNGSCGSGTAVARPATAVAVRYSGENPVAPIEVARSNTGSSSTPTTSPVNTGNVNDTILSLYGSSATSFSSGVSQSASGADTASAFESTVQTAPGPTSPQSATTSSAGPWVALTVAVAAADGGCSGNCAYGLEDPGGASTYYANAVTAAKTALDAAASRRPDAKKVIILLSDGVANVYSSTPCQDAIKNAMAAETATSTNTAATIYTIAYGDSGDHCSDGRSLATLGTSVPMTGACAMRLIADNPNTDTTHGLAGGSVADAQAALCSGTIATDAPEHFYLKASGSDLASVFREIGQALASPRLVSDSAT